MEPPETTDLRRIPVLFLDLAASQSDTITHTYISTEKRSRMLLIVDVIVA